MASKIPIQPGQTYIGFMKTDGTLIGSLAKPSLGHDLLASQLGIRAESGLQPGIVAITVGKMSDGTIQAFGSGKFGPLPDYLKALAKRLVQ